MRDNVEVDNGVEDSGANKDAESKECGGIGRAGEDVKESKDEEWDDILNIIQYVCLLSSSSLIGSSFTSKIWSNSSNTLEILKLFFSKFAIVNN